MGINWLSATFDATVKAENQDLLDLACVMKRVSAMTAPQDPKRIVYEETMHVVERNRQGNSPFSRLGEIHNFLEVGYQQHNQTLISDSKHTQLDSTRKTLIRAQPFFFRWIGYDYRWMYWEPWLQSQRQIEALDAPVTALARESQSQAEIHELRKVLQQGLTNLTLSLSSKGTETSQDGDRDLVRRVYTGFWKSYYKYMSQEPPARISLQEWYWQHVARHAVHFQTRKDFDVAWDQLDCEVPSHAEL